MGSSTEAAKPAAEWDLRAFRRILLIAGTLLYLAYALVTPPFETPDEHQHLFRAWQLASFQLHGERRGNQSGGMLPAALPAAAAAELGSATPHASRGIPKRPLAEAFARQTPVQAAATPVFTNFVGSIVYSPVGYVPQVIAIWTGRGLGLSVESIVRLGRLLNAALTLGLFALALTLLPVGRLFVLLVALMPMSAAMASSLGQDGLILGGSALLVALGVRARLEGAWRREGWILLGIAAAAIALSKIVYLPLVAVALLPLPPRGERARWIAAPLACALVAAALAALWLESNAGVMVRMTSTWAEPTAQLAFIRGHPADFVAALGRTFVLRSIPILLSTFTFGWLTVGPVLGAALLALLSLGIAIARGDALPDSLGGTWRAWSALIALGIAGAIATAMYLAGSPLGAPIVDGIQGRYFLPLLPLLCLAAARRRGTPAGGGGERMAILLMLGANAVALAAIAGAFYRV